MVNQPAHHLETIDAGMWPGVATLPRMPMASLLSKRSEIKFAQACSRADIDLLGTDPDLIIEHEAFFLRLSSGGWLGLAESFMAGEWHSERLADVLTSLLASGYHPRGKFFRRLPVAGSGVDNGGELPSELIRLSSGDGMSGFGGIFASGVPTTLRTAMRSYVPGAGHNREPASHFVDITRIADPVAVERADLGEAQRRAAASLLDAAQVKSGSHLLEYPSSGGAITILAARRQATVDIFTADSDQIPHLLELYTLAGIDDDVHLQLIDNAIPGANEVVAAYDSIVSVEKLEVVGENGAKHYIKSLDSSLATGGNIALQSLVATEKLDRIASESLSMLRAYIWPALKYQTVMDIHRLVDRESNLRIVHESHFSGHYLRSVQLQREIFEGQQREAAADGIDAVFRRMWIYHYALIEALLRLDILDAVQFKLTTRNRRGKR